MSRPKIHPSVLADKGVPLALLGGRQVNLVYGFQALMLLEERYGSLQGALKVVDSLEGGQSDAKAISGLVGILACGLAHEVGEDGESLGEPNHLAYYLDTADIGGLGETIGEAFRKSFPQAPAAKPGGETPDPTQPSPGPSGTGGLASTSASASPSGGA